MRLGRFILRLLVFLLAWSGTRLKADEKNAKCPLMTNDDADPEYTVEYEGQKVLFCCEHCAKRWRDNEKYIIKASLELLPQFKELAEKLALDKIMLLPQRFCPMHPHHLVTPDCPTVEYMGRKIYLWDEESVKKWNMDPDGNAKRAREAGLLPQLDTDEISDGKSK